MNAQEKVAHELTAHGRKIFGELERPDFVEALGAIASRGKNKGFLKASRPSWNKVGHVGWLGIMQAANPFKAPIMSIMMLSENERDQFNRISRWADKHVKDLRGLDKDRMALESMGVW